MSIGWGSNIADNVFPGRRQRWRQCCIWPRLHCRQCCPTHCRQRCTWQEAMLWQCCLSSRLHCRQSWLGHCPRQRQRCLRQRQHCLRLRQHCQYLTRVPVTLLIHTTGEGGRRGRPSSPAALHHRLGRLPGQLSRVDGNVAWARGNVAGDFLACPWQCR